MKATNRPNTLCATLLLTSCLLLLTPLLSNFLLNSSNAGVCLANNFPMMTVSGKVIETMTSGGYTYALVKKDGVKTWVALPKSNITLGDEITCKEGMVMNNFPSSSLGRTFDHIVFSGGIISLTPGSATEAAQGDTQDQETAKEEPPAPKPVEDWGKF